MSVFKVSFAVAVLRIILRLCQCHHLTLGSLPLEWQHTFRCIDIATYHGWAFTGTAASPLICVPLTLVAALRSKRNIQLSTTRCLSCTSIQSNTHNINNSNQTVENTGHRTWHDTCHGRSRSADRCSVELDRLEHHGNGTGCGSRPQGPLGLDHGEWSGIWCSFGVQVQWWS